MKIKSEYFKPSNIDGETWTPSEKAALLQLDIEGTLPIMGGLHKRTAFMEKLHRLGLCHPGKISRTPDGQSLAAVFNLEFLGFRP